VRVLTPTENNRLNELLGFLGVTIAVLIALALLSYSPHDPSFNVSADSPDLHAARNWIGPVGAYGADLFFQGFGYAAFLLPVGIFLLGYRWFRSEPMDSPAIKLAGYSMLVLMVPTLLTLWRMPDVRSAIPPGGLLGIDEAIAEYEAALRIRPNHPEVHNNLGNALGDLGSADEAMAHYKITLQQKPEHADAHNNLGVALAMKGQFDEAIEHFHAAMRYKPNDASAHSNLGNTYGMQGKFVLAIPEYTEAIRLNPKDSQAQNNLAITLFKQGKVDEAISHYRAALDLKPNDPQIHYNLGIALLQQGKQQEAVAHYKEAVRLKPDYAEAQTQLRALGGSPSQ